MDAYQNPPCELRRVYSNDIGYFSAQNEEEKLEIEDGNRLSVIAGDFLMAAASSQLAEIENQTVVAQISKSIADISSGTLHDLSVFASQEEWLQAKSQRDLSLVKRAAWSAIILQEEQFNEDKLIGSFKKYINF